MDDRDVEGDLDDYLDVAVPVAGVDQTDETQAVVAAPDEEFAERLLYKATRLTAELGKIQTLAASRRKKIDDWEADRSSGIGSEIRRISQSCELFIRQWLRDNPRVRRKSIPLPNGTLSLAAGKGKIHVDNEGLAVAWLKEHRPDLIRWEPAIKKTVLSDENVIVRKTGPQINIDQSGDLWQSYRLMAWVPVCPVPACPECGTTFPPDSLVGRLPDPEDTNPPTPVFECTSCRYLTTAEFERVSVPGVVFVEPVQDRFTMKLTTDKEQA